MLIVQLILLTVGMHNATQHSPAARASLSSSVLTAGLKKASLALLASLSLLSFVVAQLRTVDPATIKPYRAEDGSRVFTAGIQTIHFGAFEWNSVPVSPY